MFLITLYNLMLVFKARFSDHEELGSPFWPCHKLGAGSRERMLTREHCSAGAAASAEEVVPAEPRMRWSRT